MQPRPMTYEEFSQLPEGTPAQLIGGMMVCEPAPTLRHQSISMRLTRALANYLQDSALGSVLYAPVDVRLADDEIYQPDIIVVADEQFSLDAPRIEGAPMLVVEILSPSTAYYDLRHKRSVYARSRVPEYWIVDPIERSIEVQVNRDGAFETLTIGKSGDIASSQVLPGFTVAIDDIIP